MKQPNALTIAMIRDPEGSTWQAQIQMEYKHMRSKDVLRLSGGDPMTVLRRVSTAIEKKFSVINGVTVKSE